MGNSGSKQWRDPGPDKWTEETVDNLKENITKLDAEEGSRTKGNILLCGPNQSGKSSFLNSVIGIRKNRPVHVTHAGSTAAADSTLTRTYIRVRGGAVFNNYRLSDAPGLLEPRGEGLNVEDIVSLVQGKIKQGYVFVDGSPIENENEFFNSAPTEEDKIHCLVFVFDVNLLETVTGRYQAKIRKIMEQMSLKGIPYAMVLTKIDLFDTYVRDHVSYIHQSFKVGKAVEDACKKFGIQERSIFPVINLVKEIDIKPLANILHLIAMKNILGYTRDFLDERQ
ncbi:interferon-induced protein 44-like [Mercenaria mercenaria]|uniref:interferon-induced protein 44-like n=1 Tax=Mercenaria mercenaria TaxID=6596 RepID=UPI00234F3970|nr:interferon-induced protein 44-like [Mercenaria mercenaria]